MFAPPSLLICLFGQCYIYDQPSETFMKLPEMPVGMARQIESAVLALKSIDQGNIVQLPTAMPGCSICAGTGALQYEHNTDTLNACMLIRAAAPGAIRICCLYDCALTNSSGTASLQLYLVPCTLADCMTVLAWMACHDIV